MRYALLLFSFFLQGLVWAQTSDYAVFRTDKKSYFLSDVSSKLSDFEIFRCLKPDSILLESLHLDSKDFSQRHEFSDKNFELSEFSPLFYKIIQFAKFELFFEQQKLSFSPPKKVPEKCLPSTMKVPSESLLTLYKMEVFLQERFGVGTILMTEQELIDLKNKNQKLSPAAFQKLVEVEKQKKMKESIELFLLSLEKKTKEHVFF